MPLNIVTSYIDEELAVDYIYIAFSKAFDRVSHRRLAIKLNVHGIEGEINRVSEWLSDSVRWVVAR